MKIGIPQSLLYFYYYPFWKTYFDELGIEVISTPPTSKEIIDKGIKVSVPELCAPIKIYLGHIVTLFEQELDYILIPRFVSIRKGQYFCPKFMGLPDMIRHSIKGIEDKMLIPVIITKSDDISDYKSYKMMEEKLGITSRKNKMALERAKETWLRFRELCKEGIPAMEASDIVLRNTSITSVQREEKRLTGIGVTIGLLGYVYNIYDPFISMEIMKRLREMGVKVYTFEMLDESILEDQLRFMSKKLFWTFSDKLMAAGYAFYNNQEIDGVIHVTAFGCGPDSMLGKLLEIDSKNYQKPFMTIRVDEHSGESHLQTRIEAFVDMIKRKKSKFKRGA